MQLTVVIACYNAAATLDTQLESLARQVNPPRFDVLVVENKSTQPCDDVVARFADLLTIRRVEANEFQGTSYARNVGLRCASGDAVVFVDADDCAGPAFLRAAHDAVQQSPFVTGNVVSLNSDEFDGGVDAIWARLANVEAAPGLLPVDAHYPVFMGGASVVRKAEAIELRGFDQAYFPGAEDNDLGLRAHAAGYPVMRCNAMVLAERRRSTPKQAFRRSMEGGMMHMRLCAGHDLWDKSPHLRQPAWWWDLLKMPLWVGACLARGGSASDRQWTASRAGLRIGQAVGFARYRILRERVHAQLGIGL